ncbi:MAG: hypothetical protein WBG50_15060 [Desulfomonilaceae bacterium]
MTETNRETGIKRATADFSGQYLDLTVPYWFSSMARRRHENLQVGSYVTVQGLGEDQKFELVDVFPQFGSCRVRGIGKTECLLMPWAYVSPWKKAQEGTNALTQAIGDWLFGRNRVHRLSEPNRMLKTRKINWDRETSDVEDGAGRVFRDVSWDDLEFADDVEYRLPDDE